MKYLGRDPRLLGNGRVLRLFRGLTGNRSWLPVVWRVALLVAVLSLGALGCEEPSAPESEEFLPQRSDVRQVDVGPRLEAVVAGSVTVPDRFKDPVTTVFILNQNVSGGLQVLASTQAVLFGPGGKQLGTKSWGARPIILAPGDQILTAYTFERTERWNGINVRMSDAATPTDRRPYGGLEAVESEIVASANGVAVKGVVANTGDRTAYEAVLIVVGYGERGRIVSWGYQLLDASPLVPGRSRQFQASDIRGDVRGMLAHRVFVFAQQAEG